MADAIEQRDFFISFNSTDLAYAEAIDAALRAAGFTTFYHPNDLGPGGNIPLWMDNALMNSRQLLALCSPKYMSEGAVYSEAERYSRFWQDTRGAEFKLVPIELQQTKFTPLMSPYKRIDVKGMKPAGAGKAVVAALKKTEEVQERKVIRSMEPLPKVFNVLYRHNPNFIGRFEAMDSLQKSLRDGNAVITAVAGIGGVGKTTLAAEYCHRFGGLYGGVWWVRAEQESVMLADLAALGQRLSLPVTNNIEADARAALENVASRDDPWLMVYDNTPNADAVAKWLPTGGVRCLITSRFAGFDHVASVTKLGQWLEEVTADYLLARTGRIDKEGALRLGHTVGGLPLAAEQAAVFLKDRRGISFDDYAKEIARLIKEEKPAGAKGDYPDTVYAAFVKSLETLHGMRGGKSALDLLRLCSFLSPDGVDLNLLLVDQGIKIFPADFAEAMHDKFRREDALAALASLSLLRQEDGSMGPVLIFHRLLLEVTRDWMGADTRAQWGEAAAQLVSRAFPYNEDDNPSRWPLCARLMPHIAPLQAHAPRTGKAGMALDWILNEAGLYLNQRGDRTGAMALVYESVALKRNTRTDDPLDLAAGLNNLGRRYDDLGRLDEAEAIYREVLAIKEPRLDPNSPNLAITLSNLAGIHLKRKQFAEAESLFLRVLEIEKAAHGPRSAVYGSSLSNLAAVYVAWSDEPSQSMRIAQAEAHMVTALSVTRAALGTRHPQTGIREHNFAALRLRRADLDGAVLGAERATAIMLSLDLAQHPNARSIANDLCYVWELSGQAEKAARLRNGDISDLLPVILQIEADHHAWVAEDPQNRHFGPPPPSQYEAPPIQFNSAG